MIDRVEVMRGGGSALFGSSAIGGTINIITKDPDRNSAEVGHTITRSATAAVTTTSPRPMPRSSPTAVRRDFMSMDRTATARGTTTTGTGFTEIPQLQSQSLGLRSFFKTSAYSRITLQYNTVMEYRRGGDRLDLPPHEA